MSKKILLCAYAFPPIAGPQAIRWLQFVKHLSSKGWNIDILTVKPSKGYPRYNVKLLEDLPNNIRIFRTYPGPLHRLVYGRYLSSSKSKTSQKIKPTSPRTLKLRKLYRGLSYFLIPDRMIEWLPYALKKGKELLQKNQYDMILSSGFPFSTHVVAYFLKKISNLPWVADYGDPWGFHPSDDPKLIKFLNRRMEEKILRNVDSIIVTTKETKDGYLNSYQFLPDDKIAVIPQGFDDRLYKKIRPITSKKFRIVFTGNLSYSDREAASFFRALSMIDARNIEVVISGYTSPDLVMRIKRTAQIKNTIEILGFRQSEEIVALQKGGDVLISFGWRGGFQIPGKIFEYIAARRPILHVYYDDKDIGKRIIRKYNRGIAVNNDPVHISDKIKDLYRLWKEKKLQNGFDLSPIDNFSWKKNGEKLEKTVNRISNVSGAVKV
jgi:hypothetical protein